MTNKNQKTFSDLLNSSIDSKNDDSFNEVDNTITFDNIAQSDAGDSDSFSFDDLVNSVEDDNHYESVQDSVKDVNDDVVVEEKNEALDENVSGANLFFGDNEESEVSSDDLKVNDDKDLADDVVVEEKNEALEENVSGSNLFFGDNRESEVFSDDLKVNDDKDLDDSLNKNVFFDDSEIVDHNSFSENNSVDLSNNVFFQSNQLDEINHDDSIVDVDNHQDSSALENTIVSSDVKEQKDISDKSATSSSEKSTSPFFESSVDESSGVENPLLLNTLNLIENENKDKKNVFVDTTKSRHFNVKIVKKKEPLLKVILGVLSYALFIWLLLVGIVLLIYVLDIRIRASKGDYSAPTYNAYVVLTGSMLPKIQVYDVVVTKKVDASKLEVGDVITFSSADTRFLGTIITHRIIKKNYDAESKSYNFQTKGDNNNVADSALVPQNNIYGKVIIKIPKLGYLQEFLASDGGWIIVILIPCLAVISYDIVKLIKGLKRKKYKNIKVQK